MSQSGSQFGGQHQAQDGDENKKSLMRRQAVSTNNPHSINLTPIQRYEINKAVEQAKLLIIQNEYNQANRLVYDTMTQSINSGSFQEQSIELLPAFFVLATANICLGGARLKKAENFLVSAFWNLLKSTSDESEKRNDED